MFGGRSAGNTCLRRVRIGCGPPGDRGAEPPAAAGRPHGASGPPGRPPRVSGPSSPRRPCRTGHRMRAGARGPRG